MTSSMNSPGSSGDDCVQMLILDILESTCAGTIVQNEAGESIHDESALTAVADFARKDADLRGVVPVRLKLVISIQRRLL